MKNIGKKYGLLHIVDRKRENNRTYYFCKCTCGNSKWIRADLVTRKVNGQKSCGCLMKETQFKMKDLKGKKFGRLLVINKTNNRDYNGCVIWNCQCNCGNKKEVAEYLLVSGGVRSCGCLKLETQVNNGKKVGKLHVLKNIVEDTNLQVITREKPMAHNTSGVTGVQWDKTRQKWIAEINFKNRCYYLGRYKNKEDAIKARKNAEEKLHKAFLEEKGL